MRIGDVRIVRIICRRADKVTYSDNIPEEAIHEQIKAIWVKKEIRWAAAFHGLPSAGTRLSLRNASPKKPT